MSRHELHVLGEKLIVEDSTEPSLGIDIETAEDPAMAFTNAGVLTLPTTLRDITFTVPDDGLAVWVKPLDSKEHSAQMA